MLTEPVILGVDLSEFNDMSIWKVIDTIGAKFAILRATRWSGERGHVVDKRFAAHVAEGRKRAGFELGAYEFLDERCDPVSQTQFFLDTIAPHGLELRPSIDWEIGEGPEKDEHGKPVVWSRPGQAHGEGAARTVIEQLGGEPILYGGWGYLDAVGVVRSPVLDRCVKWVAAYPAALGPGALPTGAPRLPRCFASFDAWQFTDGRAPGLVRLDRNLATPAGLARMRMPALTPAPSLDAPDLRAVAGVGVEIDREEYRRREATEDRDP